MLRQYWVLVPPWATDETHGRDLFTRHRCVVLALSASLLLCVSLLWRISDTMVYCRAVALGDPDGDGVFLWYTRRSMYDVLDKLVAILQGIRHRKRQRDTRAAVDRLAAKRE